MSDSSVAIRGNLAVVDFFAPYDLNGYELFLRAKRLPESQLTYDAETDRYQLTTPARFAPLLGAGEARIDTQGLPLAEHLFDFQRWAVQMALDAERFALWMDTGLGKTACLLEWTRQVLHRTGGRVLIVCPLALIAQHQREAQRFYEQDDLWLYRIDTREQLVAWCTDDDPPPVGIVNYEKFIPGVLPELRHLTGLVLDECFAKGTLVDTPDGMKRIEDCRIGERILNASGIDSVSDIHRREVPFAIRITVAGERVVSSPNHPYFTQRGWVCAQDVVPGDEVMATTEAVRMVRRGICSEPSGCSGASLLRNVLLSEMADAPAAVSGERSQSRGRSEARSEEAGVVCRRVAAGRGRTRTNSLAQSHVESRVAGEGLPPVERDRPQTFRAWGEWGRFDEAPGDLTGCTRTELGGGVSFVVGRTDTGLSHRLQTRLSRARAANQYRSGWSLPLQPQGGGCEEGRDGAFARVDGLEVLESGHPDLEQLRDADGKLYFYDIGATRHPSYSVNGLLVHNSSLLKTGGGVIKWNLIKSARGIPYKLSCTATPAPNEAMEYASQAAFLEKLRTEGEILWTYFTKTEDGYIIKPHARKAFYAFMASWSLYMRDPARFGFRDILSTLPEPERHEYRLPITDEQRILRDEIITRKGGGLFDDDRLGVTERTKLAQAARGFLYSGSGKTRKVLPVDSEKPYTVAEIASDDVGEGRQALIWTVFDEEGAIIANILRKRWPSIEVGIVTGSDSDTQRQDTLECFRRGDLDVVISKPQLMGYGLNLQFVRSMIFSGIDDSFERRYQAERRAVRFGQTETVRVHEPYIPELEGHMWGNVQSKEQRFLDDVAMQERFYREALADRLPVAA